MSQSKAVLAAILALTLSTAAWAQAQETWVAVATDGRRNFGYAVGMATQGAAEGAAIGSCGVDACRIVLAAVARCVAYVRSDPGNAFGAAAGESQEVAQQTAWSDCNRRVPSDSCRVQVAQCF